MEVDEPEEETPVILDISQCVVTEPADDKNYFESTEGEQKLVNQFLDGEINFNDYIDNIVNLDPEQEEDVESEDGPIEPIVETTSIEHTSTVDETVPTEDDPVDVSSSLKASKRPRKLPPALKGLMGEANLRYARGDKETAVKICLEIIRQVPTASEPFQTLAGIYDEMGEEEKSLQMSLVAAHLSTTDCDQWTHLAEMSERLGHNKQAITCYTKAIKLDLQNLDLHRKRAILLEAAGDKKTAIRGYIRLLSSLNPDQGEYIVYLAKFVAEMCHKEKDVEKASEALDVAILKCPESVNLEFVNLQLELLLQLKRYDESLRIMERFCDLMIERETVNGTSTIKFASLPDSAEIDIVAKLVVTLIHLKADHLVGKLMEPILSLGPGETGDLFLDIVDAYTAENCHREAEPLLDSLSRCVDYDLPGVWLKLADNKKNVGKIEEASVAYYKVLERAPQHVDVRLTLASLLVQLGRADDAIVALTQNDDVDYVDATLLYEKCALLKKDPKRSRELVAVASLLFSRHSVRLRNKDELNAVSIIQRFDKKRAAIRSVRKTRHEPEGDDDVPVFSGKGPSTDDEWNLFKHVCQACIDLDLNVAFQRLTFSAQLSNVFHVNKYHLDILCVLSAMRNKDSYSGYNIVRTLVCKYDDVKIWHLFNLIVTKSEDARHNRFIMRQLARNSQHPGLGILHGNNCLVSGTYKYAMHEYSTLYRRNKQPLIALLLGLTYLQMAGQKFTSKKHQLVVQSLALLAQYKTLRGPEGIQEVHYNLGRSFHHLGLFTPATFHYKKVLEIRNLKLIDERPDVFDLSREAAFNLHLIYVQSDNPDLARMYLDKYVVV